MGTITPILDTLLHQVLGRRADMERFTGSRPRAPILAVEPTASTRTDLHGKPLLSRGLGSGDPPQPRQVSGKEHERALQTSGTGLARHGPPEGKDATGSPGSTPLHFSREGDLIAALSRGLSQIAPDRALAPLFNTGRIPTTGVLAILLGQQVAHSGLFYESHLSQWFDGRRTLEQLRQEPQGRLRTGAAETRTATGGSAQSALIDERLLPIVRQQLDTLGSSIFCWHGAAWPGVDMRWEIHEHPPESDGMVPGEPEQPQRVSTRLRFDLPTLGAVEVLLSLHDANHVQVYAWAESERSTLKLQPATASLEQRLEQAGFGTASVELLSERDA